MWELPSLPRRRVRVPTALLPTLLAVLVGAGAAAAYRGYADPAVLALPTRGHTATALADGRVLVVGGEDDEGALLTAALLFYPDDRSWRPAGRPRTSRVDHVATRLRDGRVLVVGGRGEPAGSAELFDPRSGRWRAAASPPGPLAQANAALLGDGRVLVAAGEAGHVYDPAAHRWTTVPLPGPSPAERHLLPLLDGRALLVWLGDDPSVQAYDPATSAWSPLPEPGKPIGAPAGVLPDGRVLVGSGGPAGAVSQEPLLLDPRAGTWSPAGVLSLNRRAFVPTLLPDGRILAVGGRVVAGAPARGMLLASVERYDPATGVWGPAPPMLLPRLGHTLTRLPDGRLLVVGGQVRPGPAAELYDPVADRWSVVTP